MATKYHNIAIRIIPRLLILFPLFMPFIRPIAADDDVWTDRDLHEDQLDDAAERAQRWADLYAACNELISCHENETPAAATFDRLAVILGHALESVEWAWESTDAQKEKVLLASRGDVKRLVDRIADLKKRSESLPQPPDEATLVKVADEVTQLGKVLEDGPFGEGSLFMKTLRQIATAEQFEGYETIRKIEREGGRITMQDNSTDGVNCLGLKVFLPAADRLDALWKLKNLKSLALDGPYVTDNTLVRLQELTHPEHLDLGHSLVTDAGLVQLKTFTRLKSLNLDHTQVTGAGLEQLTRLTNLVELSIAESEISDADVVHLEGFTSLRAINLVGTRVTDRGLANLTRLTSLERIKLDRTDVTDAGLKLLRTIKGLEFLSCRQTDVTDSGAAMLKRWRPKLEFAHRRDTIAGNGQAPERSPTAN